MTTDERDNLIAAFRARPYSSYGRWRFDYQYPGYFSYYHKDLPFTVMFTPDHSTPGEVDVDVMDDEGNHVAGASWPFVSYRPEDLFCIIRQWLDRLEQKQYGASVKDWSPGLV